MYFNHDNYNYMCVVLGETGAGKSTFINSITNKRECKISNKVLACTKYFNLVKTKNSNLTYYFIDTPGWNCECGDENIIKQLKNYISYYGRLRCIIIVMKFHDIRLTNSTVKNLKLLIKYFPYKKFWEHVMIVRIYANNSYKKFQREKAKIKGSFINAINNYGNDLKDFQNFMIRNLIEFPRDIDEFYVDNDEEDPNNYYNNMNEFDKIFNKIKNTYPF